MSNSNWRVDLAIAGVASAILLAFGVWGFLEFRYQERQHAQQRQLAAAYHAENSPEQGRSLCVEIPRRRARACVTEAPEADADTKSTEYDLEAQQQMARWAFAMFAVSLAGIVVTIAGLVYVILAYRKNAEATEHANTAALAATQSANAQIAQTRPWLKVSVVLIAPLEVTASSVTVHYRIVAKNVGQTPALNVDFTSDVTNYAAGDDPDDMAYVLTNVLRNDPRRTGRTVFPDDETREDDVGRFQFDGRDPGIVPTIFGAVQYVVTAGDRPRQTPFQFRIYRTIIEPIEKREGITFMRKPKVRHVLLTVKPGDKIPVNDLHVEMEDPHEAPD